MPPDRRSRNGVIAGYTVVLTNLETMEQLTYNVDKLIIQVERMYDVTLLICLMIRHIFQVYQVSLTLMLKYQLELIVAKGPILT